MNVDVHFQRRVFIMQYDSYGNPVSVPTFINNVNLKMDEIINIGDMQGAYIEGILTIENLDAEDIASLEASIELFNDVYTTGVIKLALDNYGEPGDYQDKVVFNVAAGSSARIWIKISSTAVPTLSKYDVFKYKLLLRNA
jgi:hypothetical protein